MNKIIKSVLLAALVFLPMLATAQSAERIISYDSQIQIHEDGSMTVMETIQVISAGEQIRRGIYRDFPLSYTDRNGQRYLVGFELLNATRNGSPEPYHTERAGNGIRIYLGEENVFIPPGEHTYTITYKTDRQLGFFENHDELYWNVTGNGWIFGIDAASATVTLPGNVPADQISAKLYTGPQGSSAQDGRFTINDNTVSFAATQPLRPFEGLTVVVSWPKGVVAEPTAAENFWASFKANLDYIIGLLGLALVIVFYSYAWHKHGRDPKPGAVIAQYESPQGFSPAFLRHIKKMGSDNESFAAAIINLGVKGYVKITENKKFLRKKTYTLEKLDAPAKGVLSEDEKILFDELFAESSSIVLESKSASKISKIKNKFTKALDKQAGKRYFKKNIPAIVIGIFLSGVTIAGAVIGAATFRYGITSGVQIIFWVALVLGLIIVNAIFAWLMKAYTVEGRKLADEIEGFKLFLSVTEKDRLAFHNPPEKTPELFEKMLPYALALGVSHQWAEQFKDVFARLESRGVGYVPLWYHGSFAHFSPTEFSSDVSKSFAGAVASAATPPGSSSGMSGGFSGGGGGGGGGGGW